MEYLQNLSKCSSGMFISGRCSTPVKSYGRNLIQATSPNVFCLVKELGTKGYGKERFLSLAHFLTFVYLSKCNTKMSVDIGNCKNKDSWPVWCTPCARNFPMVQPSIVYWISQNLTQSNLMYPNIQYVTHSIKREIFISV